MHMPVPAPSTTMARYRSSMPSNQLTDNLGARVTMGAGCAVNSLMLMQWLAEIFFSVTAALKMLGTQA
jgi:hypothetical protein